MTILFPSLQAERIRSAVVDYLSTTFALTDAEPRRALADFLEHPDHGVFTGPFVRLRLPYQPSGSAGAALDWTPPFPPYRHQEQAYQRLSTKNLGPERPYPQPTIVTTGTGSGKTEAFLHPILDHVLRARAQGTTGLKALILYPMNALATDQAHRLAHLITSKPALSQVRAALYTGDSTTTPHTTVTPDSLITDRYEIRRNPPDILLTNYKMLDQLLLRPEDQELWKASAQSLTYLVLDEFHTYDGAQGTDVAMLLRRLGLAIRAHLPSDDPRAEAFATSPLGPIAPVATSATLGDGGDPSSILAFAHDVFGLPLPPEAVITETRMPLQDWAAPHEQTVADKGLQPRALRALSTPELQALARGDHAPHQADTVPSPTSGQALTGLVEAVVSHLYQRDGEPLAPGSLDTPTLASALQAHPDVLDMVRTAQNATPLADLAAQLLGPAHLEDPALGHGALSTILAALSAVRAGLEGSPDRKAVSVEVTLWIRAVTRIDRALSTRPEFWWSDDITNTYTSIDTDGTDSSARPALYCRACGRSGWGITLAPTGQGEKADPSTVRRDRKEHDPRFRALLHAPGEEAAYLAALAKGLPHPETDYPGLRWYSVSGRELLTRRPEEGEETREGRVLPVLTLTGTDAEIAKGSTQDACPSCGGTDVIRFLGSAVATLLSVSLTTLFGDKDLDDGEKRALVFTDSVQDAAHRAGYVDQRSHTMSLRSALRGALDQPATLEEWVTAAMETAQDDPFDRYRLVPSDLTHHQAFQPYWDPEAPRKDSRKATTAVRRRLLFDAALEVGLQSTYGRTLEATGSVSVHVEAGQESALTRLAQGLLSSQDGGLLPAFSDLPERTLLAWVRGTLEHMRREGAIDHPWLERYKKEDGARVWIWYKRRRDQGQPAFPAGRSAPAFPRVGGKAGSAASAFVSVASPLSWYATWTRACLQISAQHAARLAAALLARLAAEGIISETATTSGARVYGIPAQHVVVSPLSEQDANENLLLVCSTCHSQLPTAVATRDQLDGAPCLAANCPGHLQAAPHPPESFYRQLYTDGQVRRVDAHEHTSLLSAQERAEVEDGFKRPQQRPGDPNVLVATPTLEMGIDIGDLSTVLLGSLPDSVASYVQRAGRAGRRNGSALALAYVPGRADQLPLLEDPLQMLNGSVAPPSTYLGAEEILRRQFIAYVIDTMAREGDPAVPGGQGGRPNAGTALGSTASGSLIAALSERIARDGAILAAAFTGAFTTATPGLERLTPWVTQEDGQGPRLMLERAAAEHQQENTALRHQAKQINEAMDGLRVAADLPGASDEDKRALRTAEGASKAVFKRLADLDEEHWVSALERHGVLPNYALIDDTVTLAARVSWRDPDGDEFRSEPYDLDRASQHALRELAPGATFYTRGLEMRIDGVDDSDLAEKAEWWFCCESCGYIHIRPAQEEAPPPPSECHRCLDATIADVGRARRVLRLTRVFADVTKDDARIGDTHDDRVSTRFEVLPLADFDPRRIERQWRVKANGFGAARYRRLTLRWLNTGQPTGGNTVDRLAGQQVTAHDFRLCEACGKLDRATGASTPSEHRPWCRWRTDPLEHVTQVNLMRDLETEAIALILPLSYATDGLALNSLGAALLLGLELTTGGAPAHLQVTSAPHPVQGGERGDTRPALLLHDTVPGGTGYLTDLDSPEALWRLLVVTGHHLERCECRLSDKRMCHRCLQPYGRFSEVTRAAALSIIRQLLGQTEDEALADLDPEAPTWTAEDEPVTSGIGESPLEARFRVMLTEQLQAVTSVRSIPDSSGAPALEIDGGAWRIRPQLMAATSRPDFTCLPGGSGQPIAIFTDGRNYHATRGINRLADDATKREHLRAQGYRVISVSAQDLDAPWSPVWLNDQAITMLKNGQSGAARAGSVTDQAAASWRGGPLALLQDMLLGSGGDREEAALSALADCVWGPLMLGAAGQMLTYQSFSGGSADPLAQALRQLRPDVKLPQAAEPSEGTAEDGVSGSVFSWPHLALAVRLKGRTTTSMALVLDDSNEALGSPDHPEAWRTWLRLSNVLPLAKARVHVTTVSRGLEEVRAQARATQAGAVGVSADQLAQLGWDALNPDLTDSAVMALVPHLVTQSVAHEADGQEVEGGIMVDLLWAEARLAVLAPAGAPDAEALVKAGWHVILLADELTQDGTGGSGARRAQATEDVAARTATEIARRLADQQRGHA